MSDEHFPILQSTVVVIPALDEALCVAQTVRAWMDLGVMQVRVVDNGSSDDTAGEAVRAGAEVLREPRRGYGAAAWTGLQRWPAQAQGILFSSADGSDRLTREQWLLWETAAAAGADLIVGDRVSLPEARRELKWVQRLGNGLICSAIQLGWGRRFRDMGSLRWARSARLLELNLQDRGFGWNVEMQVRAIQQNWRIVELPVPYYPRTAGASKISGTVAGTLRAGWAMGRMLAFLWRLRRTPEASGGRERAGD